MKRFYEHVTAEHIAKLSGEWDAAWSGGKDSTSVITWVEFLRRSGQIHVARPRAVQSDTAVEEPHLQAVSAQLIPVLQRTGWKFVIVRPEPRQKLYCQILGRGVTPVHPGGGHLMRWCTRATKIDPMNTWRKGQPEGLILTGLRLGESVNRDKKLLKHGIGCVAGGECGIPPSSANTFSPIVNWTMCNVIDWLSGMVSRKVRETMADVLPVTQQLVEIYNVSIGQDGLWDDIENEVSAARYGCIGCPAIASGRMAPKSTVKRNGPTSPLNELFDVWFVARQRHNRCVNKLTGGRGPIRMHVRKILFERVMDIQNRSGVVLITPEDEAFIRQCWKDQIYPRGWSAADEENEPDHNQPLFGTKENP